MASASLQALPHPHNRPVKAVVELGKLLFFDPALSANYKRSCASCHRPEKAFTDQRATARAYTFSENLTVNTPTLLNAGRQRRFFHDGRAGSLSDAIQSVLTNPAEMKSSYALVAQRLHSSPDYNRQFRQAFGRGPTQTTINRALTAYLESLTVAPKQRVRSLPDSLRAGAELFTQLRCNTCHTGADYRDGQRHEIEPGRWVKTPGLRNLRLTPPYLADGTAATIMAVLAQPFHARQHAVEPFDGEQLAKFLVALPIDSQLVNQEKPTQLPLIPNSPPRRIGGLY